MKVYALPESLTYVPNYQDWSREETNEAAHKERVTTWLHEQGYRGPNTGKVLRMPAGDGYAQYMFADAGPKSGLIHLPYGDAWHSQDVRFLPKREVLRRIAQDEAADALFAEKVTRMKFKV